MKRVSPYLKMQVLAAIDYVEGKTRIDRIKKVAAMSFKDEDGQMRLFTHRTIQTWYTRYKTHGITTMTPRARSDSGTTRSITPEQLLEAINQVLPLFHNRTRNKMDIYRMIVEKGILSASGLSQTSFYRMVRIFDLLKDSEPTNKRRLAFAMEFANQLWQGDTLVGPYVRQPTGPPVQTKLIAFIDDASRVLTHGQFFLQENTDALIEVLRQAFYKRGIPDAIYVDNGGMYTSQELILITARVGSILRHTPVRDGASKGKIERFFRTVRMRFLIKALDLSSLEALNKQFTLWVEESYNAHSHSGIGMKPIDRFAIDLKRIRFLPPTEVTDELFFTEETRMVKNDNTFSFRSSRYETPSHLAGKQIHIRFNRHNPSMVVVYFKGERIGQAQLVDLNANARIIRRPHNKEDRS
jgi:putative transposase